MRHDLRRSTLHTLAAAGLLALATACGSSSGPTPSPSLSITGVGWFEENIDLAAWTTPPPTGQTAFYDFIIHYSGEIAFSDIEYARVYLPGGTRWWTINKDDRYFSAADKTIGGWGRWFDNSQENILPIGDLQVEVKLTNGLVARSTRSVPAPGSLTAGAFTTMHPEDVTLPPAASAPMVRRAGLGATNTATAATQTIRLTFSVDDPTVYNGFVWFHDAADAYLGGYFFFRDSATGLVNPSLGGVLETDGTPNTLTIRAADLTLNPGASFGQIARFNVVLTDGAQHGLLPGGGYAYDCRSISATTALTLQ